MRRLVHAHQPSLRRVTARCYSATAHKHAAVADTETAARLPSILVANRGEIALRVGRTAAGHGIRTTTVFTDPDAQSQHALSSPYAIHIGDIKAYLDGDRIIDVARQQRCSAIHPGYGFLSENSAFARKCTEAGLTFIGPPWQAIEAMGNKSRAKEIMTAAGVPCIPGYHGDNQDPEFLKAQAEAMGFPVLLKAVKGGGGKGMRIVRTSEEFLQQLDSAQSEARGSFGDDAMLVEKYITVPRHIEVQIFADKHGACVALGERDCSVQRRHQKILEESPAPNLDEAVRQDLWEKARKAALAVQYEGAGTVEFIFDTTTSEFFFMEMNTRLQVEHPVTEMVTGQDLVHWQLIVAAGGRLPLTQDEIETQIRQRGHAIEARIYAENPAADFMPDSGPLLHLVPPAESEDVRVDAGFVEGDTISPHYDSMIAKLIVRGSSRLQAIQKLEAALEQYEIAGLHTNIDFLHRVCGNSAFRAGDVETGFIVKEKSNLFPDGMIAPEVFAQAAVAMVLDDIELTSRSAKVASKQELGFTPVFGTRKVHLTPTQQTQSSSVQPTTIQLTQRGDDVFDVQVGDHTYRKLQSAFDRSRKRLASFFPGARHDACVIINGDNITIFHQGQQYHLTRLRPEWLDQALGTKAAAHSVVAPMPCKVLRVDVQEGQDVLKDDPIMVIESMKMETVIRSPQDGRISRIMHRQGDLCKANTTLVEFEEPNR